MQCAENGGAYDVDRVVQAFADIQRGQAVSIQALDNILRGPVENLWIQPAKPLIPE